MAVQTLLLENPVSQLRQDYEYSKNLFDAQTPMTRNFLEQQARRIVDAILRSDARIRFTLPDRVDTPEDARGLILPPGARNQTTGGLFRPADPAEARTLVARKLIQLEKSPDPSIAYSGALLRFALAHTLLYHSLPDGRAVAYALAEDDEIASLPVGTPDRAALTSSTDAVAEGETDAGHAQVPFTPAARRFYLPQWVAFDEGDGLLVGTVQEAEGCIASMQGFLDLLHHAVAIAPYMVADEAYQRKRAGMLGQLVNQARALGRYCTGQVIATITRRAKSGELNRGMSLSLPYFDDQQLKMRLYEMEVVPGGRIPFLGAFVVRAARLESAKIAQDTRLSLSTRRHLLIQLSMLEKTFKHFQVK